MRLLLVAQSARMLAQSAARGGLSGFAVDAFGDVDTRTAATACLTVPSTPSGMDTDALLQAATRLLPADGHSGLIYGSGIDTRPDLVEQLSAGRIRFGNSAQSLRLLNDPQQFFRLLTRLHIPQPETRFTPPDAAQGWLIKPGCSEGGKGVRFSAKNRPARCGDYYQRYLPGPAYSALFLADGQRARIIGCNTQWTQGDFTPDAPAPFLFAGAINRADLNEGQHAALGASVSAITAAVGLVGLNSLDFMAEDDGIRVLEVNPRPSASMALYDEDYPAGLLLAHIAACGGALPPARAAAGTVRAFRIVFSPCRVRIDRPEWPAWCADRPCHGTVIAAGEPLCSVLAEAQDRHSVDALLREREACILASFLSVRRNHRATTSST